jgi:hypothetical protein
VPMRLILIDDVLVSIIGSEPPRGSV